MIALDSTVYLGPARVLRAAGSRIQLELRDRRVWAQSALTFTYQIIEGDEVLAAGKDGAYYVIGVLAGGGATTLTVPGDLTLRAPLGHIEISAKDGISLKGRQVSIAAQRLSVVARAVSERFGTLATWVRDTLRTRAGRLRSRIAGDYDVKAGRIREISDREVKIDGSRIHLG